MSAIAAGIVTKSTKERMLSLEAQKEELENKIELEKQRNIPPLNTKPSALFFTILQIKSTNRTKKRTSFSIRLSIVWFCLTIISTFLQHFARISDKSKVGKEELQSLRDLRYPKAEKDAENKESTLFEPLKFKLGACGGEKGIRTLAPVS